MVSIYHCLSDLPNEWITSQMNGKTPERSRSVWKWSPRKCYQEFEYLRFESESEKHGAPIWYTQRIVWELIVLLLSLVYHFIVYNYLLIANILLDYQTIIQALHSYNYSITRRAFFSTVCKLYLIRQEKW